MRLIQANNGDVVQIHSDEWYVFENGGWREMTVVEQMEFSK